MTRPSWDQTWMQVARDVAHRSRCVRDKIGAVIVDRENRIVATGYNGVASGHPGDGPCTNYCRRGMDGPTDATIKSYEDCPALHAEQNALMVCDRSMRVGGTMYVTGPTCVTCAKLLTNSGLARVVLQPDDQHNYRDFVVSIGLMSACGITVDYVA